MLKYQQIQEERIDEIKAMKIKKDQDKLEAKRGRIKDRLDKLE